MAGDGTTVIWNATTNSAYNKYIAGIGRDDCQALLQKQAISAGDAGDVTIAMGTSVAASNAANTSTFSADRRFLTWGNNGQTKSIANAVSASNVK